MIAVAIQSRGNAVHAANLGLYLDRPPLLVPERGLSDGLNFRVLNGTVTNANVGWQAFDDLNLDSKPVTLIDEFDPASGVRISIFGNTTDLFKYNGTSLTYITPQHDASGETIDVTQTSDQVTGNSTTWQTDGVKAGDFLCLGADEDDPAATWYEIESVDAEDTITLVDNYAEASANTQAYSIRRCFTGSILEPFVTEVFPEGESLTVGSDGDRWYATNNVDPVVAWDGGATFCYYPNLGNIDTCAAIRRFKNIMVYVGPSVSGARTGRDVWTSAIGQPENVSTLEAAIFRVHDKESNLIAAERIGELLAIYSEDTIVLAQFVGTPLYFVFRTAADGYGPRSARGIVRQPGRHVFFGRDGQYTFDGIAPQQTSTHVWKEVSRITSPNRDALVQGALDQGNAEILWVVPLNADADPDAGPPEYAFVGHYLEDVGDYPTPHSLRQLPATAIGNYLSQNILTFDQIAEQFDEMSIRWDDQQLQAAFPKTLIGTNDGDILELNVQNQSGTEPVSFVRFSRRPMIDSRANGVLHRVYVNGNFRDSAEDSLTVVARLFDSPHGESLKSSTEYTIAMDGSERFAPFRVSGRFVEIEMGSGPSAPGLWEIEGYDLDVVKGSQR